MKKTLIALAALCGSSVSNLGIAADRVGDFALLDQDGYFHQMSYYDDHKAIALLVQSNGSEATASSMEAFKQARAKYQDQIKFFMINPFAASQTRAQVKQQLQKYQSDVPVLMDQAQLVSEALGINKTGEVFLLDPRSAQLLYRGPADRFLGAAIEDVLAGRAVKKAVVKTSGSAVSYPAKAAHARSGISYAKDVAPILAENCARCHREGGVAPFAMNSHSIIKGFAPMIREVLLTKRMPPGQIDTEVGHFNETYALTPAETQTVIHWIEAGAEQGGKEDPLAQLTWPKTKWALGEPDLIVKVPPQKIPATGVLDYIRVMVPIEGLDRDRWVRASQYVAGDRTVLHHTLNSLLPPGAEAKVSGFLGNKDPDAARITAYIPGAEPQVEPPNTGGLLQKGSSLALQLHYTTSGKETIDASEIGLWFYKDDEVPTERMSGNCACIFTNKWVTIPPYAADHQMEQTIVVPKDARLHSMLPHMHFRGKRMRFYAEYPDGKSEELLNIAKYNYNWQLDYQLAEPKLLPAGTKIRVVAAFDNSKQNKANPDPARAVPWGQQSWDEMMFGSVTYKFVDQSDAKVAKQN
jgi:mono/diheme cytochrome c family protein